MTRPVRWDASRTLGQWTAPGAAAHRHSATLPLLAACTATPETPTGRPPSPSPAPRPVEPPSTPAEEPTDRADGGARPRSRPSSRDPISVAALAAADLTGGDLRLGAVRERTAAYTSYDVTFRSTTAGAGTAPLRISGVLNVPTGRGPFPAVVLAHGYIDPAYYVRGQGMTRERGFLAQRGLRRAARRLPQPRRVDRRPAHREAVRLGYAADVVAAAHALRDSDDVRVDPDRIALFGRSMGGGVMLKALAAEPGLFAAGRRLGVGVEPGGGELRRSSSAPTPRSPS